MSKHEKEPSNGNNVWFRTLLIVIIIAWIALALGSLAGHYLVKSKFLGKESEAQSTPAPQISSNTPEFEAPAGYGKPETDKVFTPEAKEEIKSEEELKKEEELQKTEELKKAEELKKEEERKKEEAKKKEEGGYKLQAGFFSDKDNAEKVSGKISALGYKSYVVESKSGDKSGYKVFIGGYKDKEGAEKAKESLKSKGVDVMITAP